MADSSTSSDDEFDQIIKRTAQGRHKVDLNGAALKINTHQQDQSNGFGQAQDLQRVGKSIYHQDRMSKYKYAMAKELKQSFLPRFGQPAGADVGADEDSAGNDHEEPRLAAASPRQAVYSNYKGSASPLTNSQRIRTPAEL